MAAKHVQAENLLAGKKASGKELVPRVNQLDAVELDKEVVNVLKQQLDNSLKFIEPGYLVKWDPEINAALRLIIFKFSVRKWYGTFGQHFLNIKYKEPLSQTKLWGFAFLTIGLKYIKDRSSDIVHSAGDSVSPAKLSQVIHWVEVVIQVGKIINFLVFLRGGTYSTLVDRVLRLETVPAVPGQRRNIGYVHLVRELLWHAFIEFSGDILSLINFRLVRRMMLDLFSSKKERLPHQIPVFTASTMCAVCNEKPVHPHQIGCSHIFCYYCIYANHLADHKFGCPLCGYVPEDSSNILPITM